MAHHDHQPTSDMIPVSALALDEFETGLLAIMRHFMTAFSRPETQAWQTAFAIATERWGIARGPQVAQGLLAVISSMRHARSSDFRYSNPLCAGCREHATDEEAAFCMMIQSMRRDRADQARGPVLALTEGIMDPVLIQSALAFAARFPATAPQSAEQDIADLAMPERPRNIRPSARNARSHLRLIH